MTALTFLCPVDVGVVTSGGVHALLHKYTLEANLAKMKKLLQTGVDVDCVNHLGQTSLFCAAILGQVKVTELLLKYGADPNHRCEDWSTPVHAGVFSCNASVVSGLLDAGGDLRLHDTEGRTPFDWLRIVKQKDSAQMVDFLETRMVAMLQLCENLSLKKICSQHMSTSKLFQPSLLDRIKTRGIDMQFKKRNHTKFSCTATQSFGFGKVCVNKPCQAWVLAASIPLINERDLTQADDEPLFSFTCGCLTSMINCNWRGSQVTLKKMIDGSAAYLDLLITEQEYCSQLSHPKLLLLMGVSVSDDLLKTSLVFERVSVGTLHNLLHDRRIDFPVVKEKWLLSVVLQVCEGLQYLHSHGLVMRALSSHSVVLTELTVAKLTGLGFIVTSQEDNSVKTPKHIALPPSLYRWAAPEVIKQKPCTKKADIYSLCALIQELYTDCEPWGAVSLDVIKKVVDAGRSLAADRDIPQPYYDVVLKGLQRHPQDRTCSTHSLCQILQRDIKEFGHVTYLFELQRFSLDDRLTGRQTAYAEQDVGPGIQFSMQQKIVEKPVLRVGFRDIKPVKPQAARAVDRYVQQERHMGEEWHRDRKTQLQMETKESDEDESVDHYTSAWSDFERDSTEGEADTGREMREHLDTINLSKPTVDQEINTLMVNLKVSQELLQQANWDLDVVEKHRILGQAREDHAPPDAHTVSCCAATTSSLATNLHGASAAVGPPSKQYRLLAPRGEDWTKNLEEQLQSRDWELLSQDELDLWQSLYPGEEEHFELDDGLLQLPPGCHVTGRQSVKMELSKNLKTAQESEGVANPSGDPDNTKFESFPNTCEEAYADPAVTGTQTHPTPDTYIALLAELSSITCSSAEPQEKFDSGQGPFCNSTPCNPDLHRRAMADVLKVNLPDYAACSRLSPVHLWMKSSVGRKASSLKPPSFEMDSTSLRFDTAVEEEELFPNTGDPKSSFHRSYGALSTEHKGEKKREGKGAAGQEEEEGSFGTESVKSGEGEEQQEREKEVMAEDEFEDGDNVSRVRQSWNLEEEKGNEEEMHDWYELQTNQKKEPRFSQGPRYCASVINDTDRAHSTLDDALQRFAEKEATQSRGAVVDQVGPGPDSS